MGDLEHFPQIQSHMLIALTIDTLSHSSSPVIGFVINFLNLENSVYVIMSDTKFCDTNATQYRFA